ncbi:nuclease-related domain-containing protein [uncultured Methanobrevibacter sp.]|uniref:nuclease-related domain-containing protein n=1 Tax=uncultured Methanobrevibacter sp. TaxID=253161 RepID=UPI002633416C|nr:nuclease-related domain-containing protein [uncultured Methanobrevibacter sp.]
MKVVCCKNCGAKYQLEEDDDISAFECSSCAGDLEVFDDYSNNDESPKSTIPTSQKYEDSYIVQCNDCGLKYKINKNDNILDYECDSCGGPLRYLDDEMNKEVDRYLEERKEEIPEHYKESNSTAEEQHSKENTITPIHSVTHKLESFFSEDQMQKIADEELEKEMENKPAPKTARTTIPQAVLSKFGREFSIPKSNDYNILKKYLKDEFFKGMEQYYKNDPSNNSPNNFLEKIGDKLTINEPNPNIIHGNDGKIEKIANTNNLIILIGLIIFVMSIIEILTINSGFGIVTLFISVIALCYGFYKSKDTKETETRTRIIREHLLTLPEDYYVFYNVKLPTSPTGINHVVIGPSGIYALISQKYKAKNRLESENENLNLIDSVENENKMEEIPYNYSRRFKYTTKQAKFSQDNKIKQKSLMLGENLINFLNENNIRHCFVEPLVGFINNEVVVINTPLTDEDLFMDELLHKIEFGPTKLNSETIDKCAVLLNKYSADCSSEF